MLEFTYFIFRFNTHCWIILLGAIMGFYMISLVPFISPNITCCISNIQHRYNLMQSVCYLTSNKQIKQPTVLQCFWMYLKCKHELEFHQGSLSDCKTNIHTLKIDILNSSIGSLSQLKKLQEALCNTIYISNSDRFHWYCVIQHFL